MLKKNNNFFFQNCHGYHIFKQCSLRILQRGICHELAHKVCQKPYSEKTQIIKNLQKMKYEKNFKMFARN